MPCDEVGESKVFEESLGSLHLVSQKFKESLRRDGVGDPGKML